MQYLWDSYFHETVRDFWGWNVVDLNTSVTFIVQHSLSQYAHFLSEAKLHGQEASVILQNQKTKVQRTRSQHSHVLCKPVVMKYMYLDLNTKCDIFHVSKNTCWDWVISVLMKKCFYLVFLKSWIHNTSHKMCFSIGWFACL